MAKFFTTTEQTGRGPISQAAAFADGEVGTLQHLSWSAIFGGTLTALIAQMALSLLGVGIGLTAAPGVKSFSVAAGIWLVLSAIAAYAIGGFLAARLSGGIARSAAGFQGIVTWALTTVVLLFMLTTAVGGIVGGTLSAVTGVVSGAGGALSSAVKSVAPAVSNASDPLDSVLHQLKSTANDPANAAAANDALAAVRSALSSKPDARAQATDQAAQALAKARNIPVSQARQQVESYEQQFDHLTAQAKEATAELADKATDAAAGAALGAAVSLFLGAIAAFFGGRYGAIGLGSRLISES